jgi:hypothetical protein
MGLASIVLRVANHCSVLVLNRGQQLKVGIGSEERKKQQEGRKGKEISQRAGYTGEETLQGPRRQFQLLVANSSARVAGPWEQHLDRLLHFHGQSQCCHCPIFVSSLRG